MGRPTLHLKLLDYDTVPVHLNRDGGEQFKDAFRSLNPQCLVPVLQHGDATVSQSLAIIEYLDERFSHCPLWHSIALGLSALASSFARAPQRARFCFQDAPTLADCRLVPQLYKAQRFNVDLSAYPTPMAIDQACQSLSHAEPA